MKIKLRGSQTWPELDKENKNTSQVLTIDISDPTPKRTDEFKARIIDSPEMNLLDDDYISKANSPRASKASVKEIEDHLP